MFNFPGIGGNYSNDLNQAVNNINTLIVSENVITRRQIIEILENFRIQIMADIAQLKDAVAANEASIAQVADGLTQLGETVTAEGNQIKTLIEQLQAKANLDGLGDEISRINASSERLASIGTQINDLGTAVSGLVSDEAPAPTPVPVPPIEPTPEPVPPVEPPIAPLPEPDAPTT